MLMKKIGTIAATGALLLAVATPAFAKSSTDVTIFNHGSVDATSISVANSGANGAITTGDDALVKNVNITTGAAVSSSVIGTELNNNTVTVTSGDDPVNVNVTNCGDVNVMGLSLANSGLNGVVAGDDSTIKGVTINSGNATAGSNVQSLVNVNSVTVTNNE